MSSPSNSKKMNHHHVVDLEVEVPETLHQVGTGNFHLLFSPFIIWYLRWSPTISDSCHVRLCSKKNTSCQGFFHIQNLNPKLLIKRGTTSSTALSHRCRVRKYVSKKQLISYG